jgi:hypothetical protein
VKGAKRKRCGKRGKNLEKISLFAEKKAIVLNKYNN